jgi:7-cyano-7-deazaguanine synthase
MKTIAVFSGGLDSTTMIYDLLSQGIDVEAVSFNYGQRHAKELDAAKQIAYDLNIRHEVINLVGYGELISEGISSLMNRDIAVPEGAYDNVNMRSTVVPNRNMSMLSMAAGVAVARKADSIATAVHAGDHAIYPDCRPDFIRSLEQVLMMANQGFIVPNFGITVPYLYKTKTQIAKRAKELNVPFDKTWSCYKGGMIHCGKCGTCVERLEAIHGADADDIDKTLYEDNLYWKAVTNAVE